MVSEVPDTGGFIENGSTPQCLSSTQTNFLESKPRYVCCILNMFTCIHEVPKAISFSSSSVTSSPTQTSTHTHAHCSLSIYFPHKLCLEQMASFMGMFVNSWVGSIKPFYGGREGGRDVRGRKRVKGGGQNTSKSDCVVLLGTQLLVSKLSVSKLHFKAELTVQPGLSNTLLL